MIIEYRGKANRWAGTGEVHEVAAWWNVNDTTHGKVKRAAVDAVRAEGAWASVTFESWDMSTYSTPQLNALIRVRCLTSQEVDREKELKSRRYTKCDGCGKFPGEVVRVADGSEQALCFTCQNKLPNGSYKVLHWIKADGRLQI